MKIFLFVITLVILTTQIKNIFNIKTKKEYLDNDQIIRKGNEYSISTTIISVCIILIYYSLCVIYIKAFIFSVVCFIYCLWTIFNVYNTHKYLKSNIVSKTLNSKVYIILSKPFCIGFSLYIIYFITTHWS